MWKILTVIFVLGGSLPLSAQGAPLPDIAPTMASRTCAPASDTATCEGRLWPAVAPITGVLSLQLLAPAREPYERFPRSAAVRIPKEAWPFIGCGAGALIFGVITLFADAKASSSMLLGCVIGTATAMGASQEERSL
ncbi:MAG: hypothetical protein M3418_13280 [Gemmatimonadota bacterium]|nr:hypothetical protein [Gemmatimonadota bacterium]